MKTATIIIHYNRDDLTRRVLGELDGLADLYVLDNGSVTPFVDSRAKVIRMEANRGFIGGANVCMTYAYVNAFSHVWLLNNDIYGVSSDMRVALELVASCFDDLAVVSPAISGSPHSAMAPGELREVGCIDWVAPLISVRAYAEVGPFDEDLKGYGVDIDYCYRARQQQWRLLVDGRMTVQHQMGATIADPAMNAGHNDLDFALDYLKRKYNVSDPWSLTRL